MRNCEMLPGYIDRRLGSEARESFEQHLSGCADCQRAVEQWSDVEQKIPGWLERTAHDDPQSYEIQRLEALARERNETKTSWGAWQTALVTGAAAVLIVVFGATFWFSQRGADPQPSMGPVAQVVETAPPAASSLPVYVAPQNEPLTTQLDQDTLAVLPSGKARLTRHTKHETRVALEKGSIACQVAPRTEGRSFSVQAGEFTVRVIGTEFLVTHSPGAEAALVVVVAEGTVQVASKQDAWTVGAGETFEFSSADRRGNLAAASAVELALVERHLPSRAATEREAVASHDPTDTPEPRERDRSRRKTRTAEVKSAQRVELSTARGWLAAGRIADAKTALDDHLEQNPQDAAAWNLHGDCQRKARDWNAAVRSYDKAISHGGAQQASRARYMAAQVLQKNLKDHKKAVSYLEAYIASGKETVVMIDVAKINLARSLISLGQKDRASALLKAVIATQGDSFVATNARHLLKKID